MKSLAATARPAYPPLLGYVVILFYGLIQEQTWFRQLLETKLFDRLGKSSYAFYLIHFGLFSDLLQQAIGRNILLLFVVLNVAAILLYELVEHPLHSTIIKGYKKKQQEKVPVV